MKEYQNIKNIFAKAYFHNWSEEGFVIKKNKISVLQTYVINSLNGEEIVKTFHEKNIEKKKNESERIHSLKSKEIRR